VFGQLVPRLWYFP